MRSVYVNLGLGAIYLYQIDLLHTRVSTTMQSVDIFVRQIDR